MTEPPKPPRQKVVFGLQPLEEAGGPSVLEEEREKHRKRAEKFGVAYKEPAKVRHDLQLEAKRERFARPGFVTGFDFFSEEEVQKRAERAKKFGLVTASTAAAAAAAANGGAEDMQTDELVSDPTQLANLGRPAAARSVAAEVEAAAAELRAKVARGEKFGGREDFDPKREAEKALLLSPEDADLFEKRVEAPLSYVRRKEAVYLYGVDYMSTGDCLAYFEDYGPSMVEWINDSSCNVVFADEATTLRAMMGRGQPIPPDIAPPPEGEAGMPGPQLADLHEADPASAPYLWFRGADFMLQGRKPIKLIYRMATTLDYKDPHKGKESRYLWQRRGRHQRHGGGDGYGDGSGRKRSRRRGEGYGGGYGDDYGDADCMEWEGGEEEYEAGNGHHYGQQQRRMGGPRGGRKARRKRMKGAGAGDVDGGWEEVDMQDAEDAEDYGAPTKGSRHVRSTIASAGEGTEGAAAAAAEEGGPPAPADGVQDLRDVLHRVREAAAPPPVPAVGDDDFEEVPQPGDDPAQDAPA